MEADLMAGAEKSSQQKQGTDEVASKSEAT